MKEKKNPNKRKELAKGKFCSSHPTYILKCTIRLHGCMSFAHDTQYTHMGGDIHTHEAWSASHFDATSLLLVFSFPVGLI